MFHKIENYSEINRQITVKWKEVYKKVENQSRDDTRRNRDEIEKSENKEIQNKEQNDQHYQFIQFQQK